MRTVFGAASVLLGLVVGAVLVASLWSVARESLWKSVQGALLSSAVERFKPRITYCSAALGVTRVGTGAVLLRVVRTSLRHHV